MATPILTPRQQAAHIQAKQRAHDRIVRQERIISHVSSFVLTFGEGLDSFVPAKMPSTIARWWVYRRGVRREQLAEAAIAASVA